jgi:hypothetical protein
MKIITQNSDSVIVEDTKCSEGPLKIPCRSSFQAESKAKGFIKYHHGGRDFGYALMTEKKRRKNVTILFAEEEWRDVENHFKTLAKIARNEK